MPPLKPEFWDSDCSRRDFLKLMGASVALAGLAGCRNPIEQILPYDKDPEGLTPGKPLFFATTLPLSGFGRGALVKSESGRPVKIEGNPAHPASLGGTDVFMQADILGLYDPGRAKNVARQGQPAAWTDFQGELTAALARERADGGAGLRLLTGAVTSPSLLDAIARLLQKFPRARWHLCEPLARRAVYSGSRLAFGSPFDRHFRLEQATTVVCLDDDLFFEEPGGLRYAREFAARRRPSEPMSRLYAAESVPTLAGSNADHRLAATPSRIAVVAWGLAAACGLAAPAEGLSDDERRWIASAAADLKSDAGRGLVVVGISQPPEIHVLAAHLNERLGNAGKTVLYTERADGAPWEEAGSTAALADELRAKQVRTLLVLDCNPAYHSAGFAEALSHAPFSAALSLYADETAQACRWHAPMAHPLEAWGDARAFDGTASFVQPLIAPLWGGRAPLEFLSAAMGAETTAHDALKAFWKDRKLSDLDWKAALREGVIPASAFSPKAARVSASALARLKRPESSAPRLEAAFRPDLRLWDGRYADNGWLQELPDPVSRLAWDNAVWLPPADADRLGLREGDEVELSAGDRMIAGPVHLAPGQAPGSVGLSFGGGRRRGGAVSENVGFDCSPLRPNEGAFAAVVTLRKTGRRRELAGVQGHHRMEGRALARAGTLAEFRNDPSFAQGAQPGPNETLMPPMPRGEYAWGMTINLGACIGCGACVIACQAENNIPIVGKEEVLRGREMHWIRVDRYDTGELENPRAISQPVPCMHCEDAPCELVCPVGATVHSAEGINEMVYNRCVGTRYCSNNCPYKVRRFNFYRYADDKSESLKLMRNPEVSVRARGVMEKCTYCIQRIEAARLPAIEAGRRIADGEVVTACQAACPTRAIVFGDVSDPASEVSARKRDPLNYSLLGELGARPRTTYLAKVANPAEKAL